MDGITREVKQAARRLVRSPAFTLGTVLTLALAIGANASIFAVVRRVLLNPLPYGESGRLIALDYGIPVRNVPSGFNSMSWQLYHYLVDHARTLDGVAVYNTGAVTLTGRGNPERIQVSRATPSLAPVMRVAPERGRWFTEEEGAPGVAPVAIVSHPLWMRRYGGDPSLLARPVLLNGVPTQVVGIMPPSYAFPDARVDVWTAQPLQRAMVWDTFEYDGVARVRGSRRLPRRVPN